MEKTVNLGNTQSLNWLDKRCRSLVFSVLAKLDYGCLEVVEGEQHFIFPNEVINTEVANQVQAKILMSPDFQRLMPVEKQHRADQT